MNSSSIGMRLLTMRTGAGGAVACFLWLALSSPVQAGLHAAGGDDIKLSGCLIRGDGDGGYLLTNAPNDPAWLKGEDRQVAPSAVGTTGGFTTIFYWLEGHGDLKEHVGHRVEVEGDLKGELKEGEIKTDRKDQWTEVTVSSDGRKMKARVPHTSVVPATGRDRDKKSDILVRRVNVEHVRMLTPSCQP